MEKIVQEIGQNSIILANKSEMGFIFFKHTQWYRVYIDQCRSEGGGGGGGGGECHGGIMIHPLKLFDVR